ncbi:MULTISPECIES: FAD-dependent monooxygenase [Mycobacteriaceae]|uniref:2,4-dichlorophenol 6-monooxygenase n=1 Tax=Mycolicibacterium neoaurum VKM Ac-1815D TaxID=700508 RepID=V5XBG5_MYCNE|nr:MULTISPECIES: FAD-dependent monooxygenase [Mycobacteriaceae]WBP95681.1 FAD-dependent monooxygenase [Mycolicibacterium neoaurum]WBS09363.1 FAD-dependent monooxygenase [Mycolicibacterium neoaurum]
MHGTTIDHPTALIVGGSLVGLSAAVFLASQGVPTTLIERHLGSAAHPRAIGYTTRTIELFRGVGIELPASTQHGPPRRARVESLVGQWFEEYPWSPPATAAVKTADHSPVRASAIAQDALEPILRERADALGADLRLGSELVSFVDNGGGVTATVRRRVDGSEYRIDADYLIAADGADSKIRNSVGIGRTGRGLLSVQRSILFRAPELEQYLRHGIVQFEIEQPGFDAFLTTYSDGRWVLMLKDDVDRTEDEQRSIIRRATGIDNLPIELITTGRWELSALIADHFACGRVFLVGDAAHQLPPNRGGYGANTGIADVHNLAWKIGAVHTGRSSAALLDTYDAERRPVAWLRHEQIFARADYKAYVDTPTSDVAIIDDIAMELGQLYRCVAPADTAGDLPDALQPQEWAGQPGTRAPHVWIAPGRSTLDHFGRGWTLVTGSEAWRNVAQSVAARLDISIDVLCLPSESTQYEAINTAYGIGPGGAGLVRPDGYIAWRVVTAPVDRAGALTAAISTAAALTLQPSTYDDQSAIADLTARYADAINRGWAGKTIQPESIAEIFTPDGVFEHPGEAPTVGAAAIAAALPGATASVPFAMHAFLNPVLVVDGDHARGQWLMWVAADDGDSPRAAYLGADMQYTRTPRGWRIHSIVITPGMRLPAH